MGYDVATSHKQMVIKCMSMSKIHCLHELGSQKGLRVVSLVLSFFGTHTQIHIKGSIYVHIIAFSLKMH